MPDFILESELGGLVAGVDEAGRGPLAGPVVAAAVIFNGEPVITGINDSKKLTMEKREALFEPIISSSTYAIGVASAAEIDRLNILKATMLAMQRAVDGLSVKPTSALVDGNHAPELLCETHTVIKGDSSSLSIAAASIIAKVTRDRIMKQLAEEFPHYGWEANAGYPTKAHMDAIAAHGITPHHRRTFAPVRNYLEKLQTELAL